MKHFVTLKAYIDHSFLILQKHRPWWLSIKSKMISNRNYSFSNHKSFIFFNSNVAMQTYVDVSSQSKQTWQISSPKKIFDLIFQKQHAIWVGIRVLKLNPYDLLMTIYMLSWLWKIIAFLFNQNFDWRMLWHLFG